MRWAATIYIYSTVNTLGADHASTDVQHYYRMVAGEVREPCQDVEVEGPDLSRYP